MKKSVIGSIVGLAACVGVVNSTYGQGQVFFANYTSAGVNAPVTYLSSGIAVGSEFTADLLYSLNGGSTWTLLAPQTGYPTSFLATDGDVGNGAGYFVGSAVTIPDYTSGPISFIVEAFNGSSYANSTTKGQSSAFTLPSIATGLAQVGDLGSGFQGFTVSVPEPTTLALAGLGGLASLVMLRRKKA